MSCGAFPRDHFPVRRRKRSVPTELTLPRHLPEFPIRIAPPDLTPWEKGNIGIDGVIERDSGRVGPEITIVSLIHGNEFAGAIALDQILREDIRPLCGVVRFVFANLESFHRFDGQSPTASRFTGEDLNRVWSTERLARRPASPEMARAQALLPVIRRSDMLLDLHSMLWDSSPLLISPQTERSTALAGALSACSDTPFLTLTDLGHVGGARLIEEAHFLSPERGARSVLLEAGQHWAPETVETSRNAIRYFIDNAARFHFDACFPHPTMPQQAVVTDNVVAHSACFRFETPYRGGQTIANAGTVIATDGQDEICTPYDGCILIMPNLCVRRGQLAVRLARHL